MGYRAVFRRVLRGSFVLGGVLALAGACDGGGPAGGQEVGQALLRLSDPPGDVACLRVTVTGARSVVRDLAITPGVPALFRLSSLPLGPVVFSGEAFALDCPSVGSESEPTWISDPVDATIQVNVIAEVELVMHRSGRANISVTFEPDDGGGSGGAPFEGGTGTPADPYRIASLLQLDQIRGAYLASTFTLEADLDASATNPADPGNPGSPWDNGGLGWNPLGDCGPNNECGDGDDAAFTGTFAGNGHTITNLFVNRPGRDGVGLFGVVVGAGGGPSVSGVLVAGATVSGRNQVGAVVGHLLGDLTSCSSSGSVTGAPSFGSGVGGLVGMMGTSGGPYIVLTVSGSSSSAQVAGGDNVGGLVGWIEWGAGVQSSFSTGSALGSSQVGGLVGYGYNVSAKDSYSSASVQSTDCGGGLIGMFDFSQVTSCYATGDVHGGDRTGGLFGCSGNESLADSFATGIATGTTRVGGLIGEAWGGSIEDCFWDRSLPRAVNMCGSNRPTEPSSGCDDSRGVTSGPGYWLDGSHAPMNTWSRVAWTFGGDLPTLVQAIAPP